MPPAFIPYLRARPCAGRLYFRFRLCRRFCYRSPMNGPDFDPRTGTPEPEAVSRVRGELAALRTAAVDASSMIYMLKAGFFGYAAAEVKMYTVGPVAREVGWPELPVRIADLRRGGEVPWTREAVEIAEAFVGSGKHGNDELLLELASARGLALVSEDRRVHERAAEEGHPTLQRASGARPAADARARPPG